MYCGCYLRDGVVYIPTLAALSSGAHLTIEPVEVVPVSDSAVLRQAFERCVARGNPAKPTPKRGDWPPPLLPKYARVKTQSAFERGSLSWHMYEHKGIWIIDGYRKAAGRGTEPDPDQRITFPSGTKADQVIERMIEILQGAAQRSAK